MMHEKLRICFAAANPNEMFPPGVPPLIKAMGYQTDPKIAELLISMVRT